MSGKAASGTKAKAIQAATSAKENAYAPYSKFKVGAAIVGKNGKIYSGCNVENVVYQGTCAERVALTCAVADGCQDFEEIFIVTDAQNPTPPCGYCRQFMAEFFDLKAKIHLIQKGKVVQQYSLGDLLPNAFGPKNLK